MIGIVVVSHSPALAAAAVALADEMNGPDGPVVRAAAGTPDGGVGTDAVAIAAAIDAVATEDGVLVVMDLGSAVLSAEMAREFITTEARVALSPAPFVEGLISAVVTAAGGASLDTVLAEAGRALDAKRAQLGEGSATTAASAPLADGAISFEAVVHNPSGLHARPAAAFARAAARHDARVRIGVAGADADAAGDSLIALMALGVHPGTTVRVTASGPDAAAAAAELRTLIESGFGEV